MNERGHEHADPNAGAAAHPAPVDAAPKKKRLKYDCSNTEQGLVGSSVDCPPVDRTLVESAVSYLVKKGMVPAPATANQRAAAGSAR
jgi:hypothetical protein